MTDGSLVVVDTKVLPLYVSLFKQHNITITGTMTKQEGYTILTFKVENPAVLFIAGLDIGFRIGKGNGLDGIYDLLAKQNPENDER